METMIYLLYAILTLSALIAMLYSFRYKTENAMSIAVWTDLLAILLLYQLAHGEIFGLFFNYINSLLYTINLLILIVSVSYILFYSETIKSTQIRRYLAGTVAAVLVVAGLLLLTNVWINARFLENRMINRPVIQVATLGKNPHCSYAYIFYTVNRSGKISYLCPNHYGLIPRLGELSTVPAFIEHQFNVPRT